MSRVNQGGYEFLVDFYIDTPGYSDRDRMMFCAGVEFIRLARTMDDREVVDGVSVLVENESRLRIHAAARGLTAHFAKIPGFKGWLKLTVLDKCGGVAFR